MDTHAVSADSNAFQPAYRSVPAHHKPYPELVEPLPDPTPYSIIDTVGKPWLPTNGMTNLLERKLLVPLVEGARGVALHELAHVKWSPRRRPKVDFDLCYLMAVEDARINLGLECIELPMLLTPSEIARVAHLAQHDLGQRDLLACVLRAIAAQGTNAAEAVLAALATQSQDVRDLAHYHVGRVRNGLLRARRARRSPVASFRVVRRLAAELAREIEAALERLGFPRSLPLSPQLAGASCCLGHGHTGTGPLSRARGGAQSGAECASTTEDRPSGEMRVVVAALPHSAPAPRGVGHGRGRAATEGWLPHYLHRWPVDRAIFRRRSRARGGTVLVDTSGSMSLDAAGVDSILTASSGAALVAIYSGTGGVGELRIVARDGQRADARDLVPFGRGNVVDEPALAWLAAQGGPKLWISDGGVSGASDIPSSALQRRCREIVQRSGIHQVKTVAEAAAFFAGRGRRAGLT